MLDLDFLYVDAGCRGQGVGHALVDLVCTRALELGAARLYVSATPSRNTVEFYLRRGFAPVTTPDPDLFAREPEDIHILREL